MALPTSNLTANAVNVELNYPANTNFSPNINVVRQLTGVASKQTPNTPISSADIEGKSAFENMTGPGSNTQASFNTGVVSEVTMTVNSSFYNPSILWTYDVVTQQNAGEALQLIINEATRSATLRLTNDSYKTVAFANCNLTASVSVDGKLIEQQTRSANLRSEVYNGALAVSGPTSVNTYGYSAQSSIATTTASANVSLPANATIQFTTTKISGATVTPVITGNTIQLKVESLVPGTVNAATYQLTTKLIYKGEVLEQNVRTIQLSSIYPDASFDISGPSSNVQFGDGVAATARVTITPSYQIQDASIVWSVSRLTGTGNAVFTVSNTTTAILDLVRSTAGEYAGTFRVTANLKDEALAVVNTATYDVFLAAGVATMTLPGVNNVESGYVAQTSSGSVTAGLNTTLANSSFTMTNALVAGTTSNPLRTGNTFSYSTSASTEGGTHTSHNNLTATLVYNGVSVKTMVANVYLKSEYLSSSLSLGSTATSVVNAASANSTNDLVAFVGTTATKVPSTGTVTWTVDNAGANTVAASLSSNTSFANVFITRTSNGESYGDYTLTGNLYAPTGELLKTATRNIRLGTVAFGGDTSGVNASQNGFLAQTAIASASVSSAVAAATKTWSAPVTNGVGTHNLTGASATLTAAASSFGTVYGTRTFRATLSRTLYGVTVTSYVDQAVTANATYYNPAFNATFTSNTVGAFSTGTVSSVGTVSATSNASMGGTYTYSTTLASGTAATVAGTGASRTFSKSMANYGTNTATYNVTVSLYDGATLIASEAGTVTVSAARHDPNLNATGYNDTTSGSGTVTSVAGVTSVTSNTSIPSRSYSHSFTKVSGTTANATSSNTSTGAATVTLSSTSGTLSATYDVTVSVKSGATVLESTTKRVSLTSTSTNPVVASASDTTPTNYYSCWGGNYTCPLNKTLTSGSTTVSATGGSGTYTYSWARVSGDTGIAVSNASAATVTFSRSVGRNDAYSAVWRCTVTSGGLTDTVDVTITLSYIWEGDPDTCVTCLSYIYGAEMARDIYVDEYMTVVDPVSKRFDKGRVSVSYAKLVPCVRITTKTGIVLECSTTAPIANVLGEQIRAPHLLGVEIPVYDNGIHTTDVVTSVEDIGLQAVQHITCENNFFLAGKYKGRYIMHHNEKLIP